MFTNVSSVGTKLDKISVQRKIIFTCSAAAILFFIKNPIVMFSIFAALLLIYFIVGGLKFLGLGIYQLKVTVPFMGKVRSLSKTSKAKDVLGWNPRPAEESILEIANQIKEMGLIK